MIETYVEKDPTAFCTADEFQTGVETLKEFCSLRTESVKLQLSGSTETVDAGDINLSDMGTMNHGMGGFGGRGGMEFPDFGNRDIADNQVPESVNVSIVLTAVSFVILGIGLLTAFFYKY